MRRHLAEYRLFFREFLTNYHTTGAVLPSGRFLAAAVTRYVSGADAPRQILEVGPGTGSVTQRIIAGLRCDDRLDLVEVNDSFVRQLRQRFDTEPAFQYVADRARILHCLVQDVPDGQQYDLIISGLPLNNFAADDVRLILDKLISLLKPGGTLSFFEYIAVRAARAMVSGRQERARLRGISEVMGQTLGAHEIRRDWIWPNVPPAWVHHLRA